MSQRFMLLLSQQQSKFTEVAKDGLKFFYENLQAVSITLEDSIIRS
jgi:hypothetical protein